MKTSGKRKRNGRFVLNFLKMYLKRKYSDGCQGLREGRDEKHNMESFEGSETILNNSGHIPLYIYQST